MTWKENLRKRLEPYKDSWVPPALLGWMWGVLSTVGYTAMYTRIDRSGVAFIYKIIFGYIYIIDWLIEILNPGFSLLYTILYTYNATSTGFMFMTMYLGFLGAGFGALLWYLYKDLQERRKPTSQS